MRAAHVAVMSAAAFGDLPTVTTVGKSVGTFRRNNDFCSKCGFLTRRVNELSLRDYYPPKNIFLEIPILGVIPCSVVK